MSRKLSLVGALVVAAYAGVGANALTNLPPPYYTVYADALNARLSKQIDLLALPLRKNVRANSTYVNTRRYLLGPDNPGFVTTPDGSGLGTNGVISVEALEVQAKTTENAAEAERCRALARWLADPQGPSPRARIRTETASAIARAARLPHPRVFATSDDFAALKKRAESDSLVKAGIDRAIVAADGWIGKPTSVFEIRGYQMLGVARQIVARLVSDAFAYRMTGERKYVDDALVELKAVCAFPNWNPRHTLDQGETALAVATAYDWLYDALSHEDRETIAAALEKHALRADVPFAGWTRLQNNWVQVVSCGLATSAVALADRVPALASAHLAAIVECLPEAESVCGPDGVYPEGPGYWNYGTGFNAIALDVMRTAFGHDFGLSAVKGFRETALYPALVTGPSGHWFNYSDSHGSPGSSPAVWWFARRLGMSAAITPREVKGFQEVCADRTKNLARTFPFTLFWVGADLADSAAELPRIWVGRGEQPIGVVSGPRDDPKSPYLAVKGGSPSYNHGHADAGSFVLDLLGKRMAFDLGAENYSKVEKAIGPSGLWSPEPGSRRWSVFRLGSQGHNTLLIGGKGQDPRGWASVTRDGDAITVDLSSLYPQAKSVSRRVSCTARTAEIVDTITAEPGTDVRWAMITESEIDLASVPGAAILDGLVRLKMSGAPGRWSVGSAQPENDWESPNPGKKQLAFSWQIQTTGESKLTAVFETE